MQPLLAVHRHEYNALSTGGHWLCEAYSRCPKAQSTLAQFVVSVLLSLTAVHRPTFATAMPWPVHLRCRLPRSASGSPLHCGQPSIFGCWLSGVELPATGGYVDTVCGDLPHSTRDVSVHSVIS